MNHFQLIEVRFLGPTNYKGARIKLIDHRFEQSKTLSYDYSIGDTKDQAEKILKGAGYEIIGFSSSKDSYFIFVDNFEPIKEIL